MKTNIFFLLIVFFFFSFFINLCKATEYINVSLTGNIVMTVPVSKEDVGYKILKDNQSNYYVLGKSGGDIILIKYSSFETGIPLWVKYFNGFENGEDVPKSMVMDNQGNIYIFGTSFTNSINTDFILIKCNSDGEQLWYRKIYNPYPSQNEPGNIILDNFGNIYFCGTTSNSAGNYDYVTYKYDNNGVILWSAIYDGGAGNDKAFYVVVDSLKNVYVTGSSLGNGTMLDIATIKYSNSGTQQWVRRYNCSTNKSDCGRFITLNYNSDYSASPIIIGESDSLYYGVQKKNIIAFKYDANGNMQWFYRHQKYGTTYIDSGYYCNAFTKDSIQNIYIGCSANWTMSQSTFYKTVKISNSGIQQWYRDEPWVPGKIFSVDINSNYLITSASYNYNNHWSPLFYRYSLDGQLLSAHAYNGNYGYFYTVYSTQLDSTDKIIMVGSQQSNSDNDIFTIKWDTAGVLSWTKSYDGNIQPYDIPSSIVLDSTGNVYISGISYGSATGSDAVIYKFSPGLTQLWQTTYKGIGFNNNQPAIIKLDSMQNIFLGTSIKDSSGYYKFILLKYVSNSLAWAKKYEFTGYKNAELKFLDVFEGNIIISGNISNQSGNIEIITLKLNLNGDTLWSKIANETGMINKKVKAMILDESANIYITGKCLSALTNIYYDFITIKYSPDGTKLWAKSYDSEYHLDDEPNSMTIDSLGNVYVTGVSLGASTGTDFLTLKYNVNGDLLWNSRYNNIESNGNDTAKVVIAGDSNSVYVGGNIRGGSNTGNDILLIKYNQFGDTIWTRRYNRAGNYDDLLKTMIKGHRGDIFIAGKSYTGNNIFDGIFIRYDKSGNRRWATSYNLGNAGTKDPVSIIQRDSIKLYTAIANYISPVYSEDHLLSLSQSYYYTGFNKLNTNIPDVYKLDQNYPNPFNPTTKIKFDIPLLNPPLSKGGRGGVSLKIFDILGREVATLVNEQLAPGTYEVDWNASEYPSGVYFYRLKTGNYVETKRMMLIK